MSQQHSVLGIFTYPITILVLFVYITIHCTQHIEVHPSSTKLHKLHGISHLDWAWRPSCLATGRATRTKLFLLCLEIEHLVMNLEDFGSGEFPKDKNLFASAGYCAVHCHSYVLQNWTSICRISTV